MNRTARSSMLTAGRRRPHRLARPSCRTGIGQDVPAPHRARLAISAASLLVAIPTAVGCAAPAPLATVSGTVRHGDRPVAGLMVTFLPDPSRDTRGAHASAVTDRSGRYQLIYRGDEDAIGAVVGWHKVVIEDFAAENSRTIPPVNVTRVPSRYRLASTTPLDVHVHAGEQTFDFQLERH